MGLQKTDEIFDILTQTQIMKTFSKLEQGAGTAIQSGCQNGWTSGVFRG